MKNLYAALVKAQGIAKAVEKDSKNAHHNYKYASAESIIEEAREALNGAGLTLLTKTWRPIPAVGGAPRIEVTYMLAHGESGECDTFVASTPVIPGQGRPEDKAEFGALTENLGYFLRNLLLLPRVDEQTAMNKRDDTSFTPAQQPRPPAPRQQPAPPAPPAAKPAPAALHEDAARLVTMAEKATGEQVGQLAGMFAKVADDMPVESAAVAFAALLNRCQSEKELLDTAALVPQAKKDAKSPARDALREVFVKRHSAIKAGVGVGS